jgi:hypothetical protein
MSALVGFAGLVISWYFWYKGLYHASRTDKARQWFFYTLNMAVNIFWCWWMFIGLTAAKLGAFSAGLFFMIDQFQRGGGEGVAFGILSIINMVLWALGGLLSMGVFGRSWSVFRNSPLVPADRITV